MVYNVRLCVYCVCTDHISRTGMDNRSANEVLHIFGMGNGANLASFEIFPGSYVWFLLDCWESKIFCYFIPF